MKITVDLNDFVAEKQNEIVRNIKDTHILAKLAEDDNIDIRMAVAENSYTPREILVKLAKESLAKLKDVSNHNAKEVASKNLCVTSENQSETGDKILTESSSVLGVERIAHDIYEDDTDYTTAQENIRNVEIKVLNADVMIRHFCDYKTVSDNSTNQNVHRVYYYSNEYYYVYSTVKIPDGYTKIMKSAFTSYSEDHSPFSELTCTFYFSVDNLKKVEIPDSVKEIEEDTFHERKKEVTIFCTKHSYAHEYCKKYDLKFELI